MDEAHHLLPAERDVSATASLESLPPVILLTVDPATLAVDALRRVDDIFAVGDKAAEAIEGFARALSIPAPELPQAPPGKGEALFWRRSSGNRAQIMKSHAPAEKAERHIRKYAEGALGEDKSFYFRGPSNALNLRAQNLTIFMQMADGVDDETWLHHLERTTIRAGFVKRSRTTSWRMNLSRSRVSLREIRKRRDTRRERRSSANTRRPRPHARL